jgi:hypothetical protein
MPQLNEVAKKWYKDGWGKGEGFPRITHTKINYWGCHNPIFDLFILIILFTKKNDEKQVKIK